MMRIPKPLLRAGAKPGGQSAAAITSDHDKRSLLSQERHPHDSSMLAVSVFQSVGDKLELDEFSLRAAVDLQYAEKDGRRLAGSRFIARRMPCCRSIIFQVIGDDRPSGSQCEACGRGKVGPHAGRPDHAGLPAEAGAHDEPAFLGPAFHYLGIVGLQALGDTLRRHVEQFGERRVLQRNHPRGRPGSPVAARAMRARAC